MTDEFQTRLLKLKAEIQGVDVERKEAFNDACRKAVDLMGLKALSTWGPRGDKAVCPPGLLRRYAQGETAPMMGMRRIVLKDFVVAIDERILANDFSERTDEDREYEIELAKPILNPYRGWL